MLKQPLSYVDQVKQLKKHQMIISDPKAAEEKLEQINYYRFTGYALQFRKAPNDSDYVANTTFEDIVQLYEFDNSLRDLLRKYIEIAEVYYRTVISHEFSMAKCSTPPHDQHYGEKNYVNKVGFKEIKDHFKREKAYYKDSLIVKHHKKKYSGKMPLWVMVEMMSMSDVSKLYSCMYYSEQDKIASVIGISRDKLKNHLHCISVLRNKCAHAARLYNTTLYPPAELGTNFMLKNKTVANDSLFSYMVVLAKRLPLVEYRQDFVRELESLLQEYSPVVDLSLIGFPENWTRILWNQTH